jgi:hypothetical protein
MVEIKCKSCNTWNTDADYCKNCNAVISMEEEARLETEIYEESIKNKPKSKFDLFIEKWKAHPNFILKIFFYIFYSVYLVLAGIGAFMAWLTLMSQA